MAPMASAPPPATAPAAVSQHASKGARPGHARHAWKLYTVRPGDTLTALAARFDTSIATLMARNHLTSSHRICVGQHMAVPDRGPTKSKAHHTKKPAPHRTAAKKPARRLARYTVRPGDTLTAIAASHHTTVAALAKANHLASVGLIRSGDSLKVPTRAAERQASSPHHRKPAHQRKGARHHLTKAERTFAGWTYPERVVRSAAATRHYLAGRPAPSRAEVHSLIISTAHHYGIDPKLALGVAWQESGWNQRAVSIAGAVGVMQVMPGTGHWASGLVGHKLNLLDAHDNITAGVAVLRYLTGHADTLNQAIGGYYQGLRGVQEHGMLPSTKVYVKAVRAHMTRF